MSLNVSGHVRMFWDVVELDGFNKRNKRSGAAYLRNKRKKYLEDLRFDSQSAKGSKTWRKKEKGTKGKRPGSKMSKRNKRPGGA